MKRNLLLLLFFLTTSLACTVDPDVTPKKNPVPINGLVVWYPFNGNANDESGKGNNGVVNGAVLSSDRLNATNSAYSFSGANCATRIDADVKTNSITKGVSVSLWFKMTGQGCISPRIYEFWPGLDGPGMLVLNWAQPGKFIKLVHLLQNKATYEYQFPAADDLMNKWLHLVYTHDGTTAKLYLNGELKNSKAVSGNPIVASDLAIGRMNHPDYDAFQGSIDDFGVWERALTNTEISKIFKGEKF